MKSFLRVFKLVSKGTRFLYAMVFIVTIIATFFSLLTTFLSKVVVDALSHELDKAEFIEQLLVNILTNSQGNDYLYDHLWILPFAIVMNAAATAFLFWLRVYLRASCSSIINYNLQTILYEQIEHLPYETFKDQKSGDLIQTCTRDIDLMRRFAVMNLSTMAQTVTTVISCFIILLEIDPKLAFVSFATIPFLFIYSFFMIRLVKYRYRLTDDAEGEVVDAISNNLNGARIIKAYNEEVNQIALFKEKLSYYRECYQKHTIASAFFYASSDIFIFLSRTLSLVYAIYLAYTKEATSGTIFLAFTFVNMIVWPLRNMATNLANLGQTMAGCDRICKLLDLPKEDLDSGNNDVINGDITFENVSFGYPDNPTKLVLKNVSFTLKKGQTAAFFGKTGAGKSSLFALLCHLYDNYTGRILIDGKDIREFSLRSLRSQVLPVLQDPFLFSMSLKENIEAVSKQASEEDLRHVIEMAGLKSTIEGFQEGFGTKVGEKGVTLSGGQRQRIAIARALLAAPPILLLDDSLSAVDMETDHLIRQNLTKEKGKHTVLMITHRIASAKDADVIIVLNRGEIAEIGTHEELIQGDGLYAQIAHIQEIVKGGV